VRALQNWEMAMKWIVIVVMAFALACDQKMTPRDKLDTCRTICGRRPIQSFSIGYDEHYDCRCGDKPECQPECDGGR